MLGRFISADTVVPNPGNPQDLNRYAYVRNSPLKYTDPSGHMVNWGGAWGGRRRPPPPLPPPPLPYNIGAFELTWLWFTEQCPERVVLDERYILTQHLMRDKGVNWARAQFYRKLQAGTLTNGTDDVFGYEYIPVDYIREAGEYIVGYDRAGFFVGSYSVHTHLNPDGTVTFTVVDPKDLASGSRSPFYYAPDFLGPIVNPYLPKSHQLERSVHSLEGLIMGTQQFKPPSDFFLASVFEPRKRSDPGPFGSNLHVGGAIRLEFTWTEPLRVDQGR